jgi:hypothetical protein
VGPIGFEPGGGAFFTFNVPNKILVMTQLTSRLFKVLALAGVLGVMLGSSAKAQDGYNHNKFKQLKQELATPNEYRTASGAPGHAYYQQQADYDIQVTLDDNEQKIYGTETITYHNNSPDDLDYVWIQLDQNMRAQDSDTKKISTMKIDDRMSFGQLERLHNDFDGGFKIDYVRDRRNNPMNYTINKTMMRVDLPSTLEAGDKVEIKIKWWYNINDRMEIGGRSGYEHFDENDNYLYTIAQFYPRMAVYNDVEGWQNKQFLGRGEFALPFGNFNVAITVPSDHIVSASGTLQNDRDVMTRTMRDRMEKARTADEPVKIVTEEEAVANEKDKSSDTKTWEFEAENVRDFAFASSRKFIWDAQGVPMGDRTVMAMSFYPKEGNPLWERYSTKAVIQTLKTYSKHTFDYPYPKAQSINAAAIGMEYPMICFNYGRTEEDGTYSERIKYGMISVIIHEVGHNFFPMIVNSDERQWTWMDEGLNTFLQFLTEQEFQHDFPSRRGPAHKIVDYMKGDKDHIMPIMTNSESIYQFGNNAYGKPATALNILRETVMGRELFDYAFKTYAQRWMFKHPTPADFFRTMEDASAVDLDWFWRGWFFTTDHVDIAIDDVKWYKVNTKNPDVEMPRKRQEEAQANKGITYKRNTEDEEMVTAVEADEKLQDFYNKYDPFEVTILDKQEYEKYLSRLNKDEKAMLNSGYNYYQVDFSNEGGLVMPVIVQLEFADGTKEVHHIPAEIWRLNDEHVSKVFFSKKELKQVTLDPYLETADVDLDDNYYPRKVVPTRFELYKRNSYDRENKMQRDKRAKEAANN